MTYSAASHRGLGQFCLATDLGGVACVCAKLFQSCPTLRPNGLKPARLLFPWDSPGKNTGVGCHFLLQEIFPTQDGTCISFSSCIAGGFLTASATWEAPGGLSPVFIFRRDGTLPPVAGVSQSWCPD